MRKIILIPLFTLLFGLNSGCDSYLDVNNNVDAPDYVEDYLYLAGIIQQYQGIYWDIRAIGPITQMMGTATYTNFASHSYDIGSDNGGEVWRVVYANQGMNLENLIHQAEDAQRWTMAGIGYAIKAFSWDLLTKLHADVPMKDAFVPNLLSHRYDSQEDVYLQIREWAYKAIEYLTMEDHTNYGTQISANDYIYKGDKAKWEKLAYAVIVRNLASLSNKTNFVADYAQELINCAEKSFQSNADNATVTVAGGSQTAAFSAYNNFWGTYRGNLSRNYFQHEYAVQVMTGSVPEYDETTGEKRRVTGNTYYPFALTNPQIVCDTLINVPGHYDPRMAVKLGTTDNPSFNNTNNANQVKAYRFYGGTSTSTTGPIGTAPSFYGRNASSVYTGTVHDGKGRWLYRDDAPYILTTYAEIQFCKAEAYWKKGEKDNALAAFKKAVKADVDFSGTYISTGTAEQQQGGDKISKELFGTLAEEYKSGPYVDGMTTNNFTLSHIMMQKWVALYPWGAIEAWVDMRKYHYDIKYTGNYPSKGNGWSETSINQKWDTDATKVYKGFFLAPAEVQNRKGKYDMNNEGSPCYRLRPRYNSEYMWNVPSLEALKPISGTASNYHCSIPWFAYSTGMPSGI